MAWGEASAKEKKKTGVENDEKGKRMASPTGEGFLETGRCRPYMGPRGKKKKKRRQKGFPNFYFAARGGHCETPRPLTKPVLRKKKSVRC